MSGLTAFTDGLVPSASNLNNLGTNIDTLCQITTGKAAATGVTSKGVTKPYKTVNGAAIPTSFLFRVAYNATAGNVDSSWLMSYDTGVVPHRDGWWRIEAQAAWDPYAPSERRIGIAVNGTNDSNIIACSSTQMAAPNPYNQRQQVSCISHIGSGTTIYVLVWQDSGVSANLDPNTQWGTWVSVVWEAPW